MEKAEFLSFDRKTLNFRAQMSYIKEKILPGFNLLNPF